MSLDARLEQASTVLAQLPLSVLRLQEDARWPWLVLIPRREGLVELAELTVEEWALLGREVAAADAAVRALGSAVGFGVEKVNVAALGNVVPQLHVHVVGRRGGDPAWPGPVWGVGAPEPYAADLRERASDAARAALPAL